MYVNRVTAARPNCLTWYTLTLIALNPAIAVKNLRWILLSKCL
jgi:hypothetical protein